MGQENLPSPGLYITDAISDLYTDNIKQLIADAGRIVTLYLPPIGSGCPNCLQAFDDSSQGIYNSANPFTVGGPLHKPFATGMTCPVCKGTNEIKTTQSISYTALIARNFKDLQFSAIGKDFEPNNVYRTKMDKVAIEDLKIADKAKIDGDICVRISDPVLRGLRDLAFVQCFWYKMDR